MNYRVLRHFLSDRYMISTCTTAHILHFLHVLHFHPTLHTFLLNSLQTCVSVKNQNIVPFIPHGPAEILSSSFPSCGTKLVSAEKQSVKVWDVIKKELITEGGRNFDLFEPITCFSRCESYIFLFVSSNYNDQLNVFDSTTLNILKTTRTDIISVKHDNCIQFFLHLILWLSLITSF